MGRINIEIPEELHRKMKAHCALNDITIIDFINDSLKKRIKKIDKKWDV